MTQQRFFIDGMHCTSCSLMIEGELEDLGVSATVNYQGGYVDTEYDESTINEQIIRTTIERLGYTVTAS